MPVVFAVKKLVTLTKDIAAELEALALQDAIKSRQQLNVSATVRSLIEAETARRKNARKSKKGA